MKTTPIDRAELVRLHAGSAKAKEILRKVLMDLDEAEALLLRAVRARKYTRPDYGLFDDVEQYLRRPQVQCCERDHDHDGNCDRHLGKCSCRGLYQPIDCPVHGRST